MLTLVVFAATATVVCLVDGKNWYYHRLPATVTTVLALLLWIIYRTGSSAGGGSAGGCSSPGSR